MEVTAENKIIPLYLNFTEMSHKIYMQNVFMYFFFFDPKK